MKEIKAIIDAYDRLDKTGMRAALATVVRVEGSSYRRMGARMLITDDGVWTGGISGGCLEGDALKRARFAIAKSAPSLITYDTTQEDAYQIGAGLGCNGIIDVLFTPIDFNNTGNPVEVLKKCLNGERKINRLLTIIGTTGKWQNLTAGQIIYYDHPDSLFLFGDTIIQDQLTEIIDRQTQSKSSLHFQLEITNGSNISLFLEILLPEIQLVLMGHQYDTYPLSRLAREAGCKVTIVANPLKVSPQLFAAADSVVEPGKFQDMIVDEYTAFVLMAHDYKTDKGNLPRALQTCAPYIGLLGPKMRSERMFRELEEQSRGINPDDQERIFSPAGLDIGATSPEEIALSIVAEIKAVLSNRDGGFLKRRMTAIHDQQPVCA